MEPNINQVEIFNNGTLENKFNKRIVGIFQSTYT